MLEVIMVSGRKSWQDKMADKKSIPKILELQSNFPCYNTLAKLGAKAGDSVVLVNPRDVEAIMKEVPKGRLITLKEICQKLAKKFNADACCTLTAGIFTMTAANAAEEMRMEGKNNKNPYWRTLKMDGFLNPKYPGGQEAHKKSLEKEGFKIVQKGKNYRVEDFEQYLTI
jgi:alkylated DNA nucleotide flippase Atl1